MPLPLSAEALTDRGPQEGRRRLTGAFAIELTRIRPDPTQPRRNLETQAQRELTDSIQRLGVLQPISVRYIDGENIYQIISGERRFQAATAAGLQEIPAWVQSPKSQDILLHQIVENWQRQDLEPLELAEALAVLRDSNDYSQKDLAALTGKPESEISRLLSLLKLDADVQQTVRSDPAHAFTKRHLTAVAQLPAMEQRQVAEQVRDRHMTAVDTEQLVRETRRRAAGGKVRGAPFGQRMRYLTDKATVVLTFRRRNVTTEEILAALDEVRIQVSAKAATNDAPAR